MGLTLGVCPTSEFVVLEPSVDRALAASNQPSESRPPIPATQRLTVDEYRRLGQLGLLTEDDRVELLEGLIVRQMNRGPRHDAAIERIDAALRPLLPIGLRLRVQSAITIDDSEPEPDLAIVSGDIVAHETRHPSQGEIELVVEVADSSVERDYEKARIYARAAVPQYWLVDVRRGCVEVFAQPAHDLVPPVYRERRLLQSNDFLDVVLNGQKVGSVAVGKFFSGQ